MRFIAILAITFMITGCSATEISERDFVVAAGIDKTENGEYKLTVIEALSGETDDESVRTSFGDSLGEAMNFESDLIPFYGQMKTVIFGESLLNDENMFKDAINTLLGDNSVNMKTIVLGCSKEAHDVIQKMADEKNGLYVWKYYKNNDKKTASTYKMTFNSIAKNENKGYVLPVISDDGLKIGGGAVMDGQKFVSWLDEKEMEPVVLLKEDVKDAVISTDCKAVKIKSIKRKVDFFRGDKNVICGIRIYMNVYHLEKDLDFKELEECFEKGSESVLEKVYGEHRVDALSFYEQMCKHKPNFKGEDIEFDVNFFINDE